MYYVRGRGLGHGRVALTPCVGNLLIRVDDDDNAEFWVEVRLRETELLRMLALVHAKTHNTGPQENGDTHEMLDE